MSLCQVPAQALNKICKSNILIRGVCYQHTGVWHRDCGSLWSLVQLQIPRLQCKQVVPASQLSYVTGYSHLACARRTFMAQHQRGTTPNTKELHGWWKHAVSLTRKTTTPILVMHQQQKQHMQACTDPGVNVRVASPAHVTLACMAQHHRRHHFTPWHCMAGGNMRCLLLSSTLRHQLLNAHSSTAKLRRTEEYARRTSTNAWCW